MIWSSRERNRSCSLLSRRSRGRIANPPLHQLEREESRLAIRGNPQNSSISLGASCPSDCANGPTGSDQWDLVLVHSPDESEADARLRTSCPCQRQWFSASLSAAPPP